MSFIDAITSLIKKAKSLSPHANVVKEYIVKVFHLDQERVSRNIDNTERYLKLVDELISSMRDSGRSETEIALVVTELKIPAVQAQLEALLITSRIDYKSNLITVNVEQRKIPGKK